METISLKQNLPLFKPKKRQAILLNTHDLYSVLFYQYQPLNGPLVSGIQVKERPYSPTSLYPKGNCRAYQLEALLTGQFSDNGEENWKEFSDTLINTFRYEIKKHKERGIIYHPLKRVLPKKNGNLNEFNSRLEEMSEGSCGDTLTLAYITSHGNDKNFVVGLDDTRMEYTELAKKFEKIKGKKAVMMLTCGSGYLLDALERNATKDDYLVITLTDKGEQLAASDGAALAYDYIYFNILAKKKVSNIRLPKILEEYSHPQIIGSYDVIL